MSKSSADREPASFDTFDDFLASVNSIDAALQESKFAESKRILWLTDQLKDPTSQVICLSYPDGTRNERAIRQFEAGLLDISSADFDSETVISNEQTLYIDCLELLRVSDNPSDRRFLLVSEGKRQLIAIQMILLKVSYDSPWVDFLKATMPGGDATEADVDEARDDIFNQFTLMEEVINGMVDIIQNELDGTSDYAGSVIQKAKLLFDMANVLMDELDSGINMSGGEANYRLHQMRMQCGISEATMRKCFEQYAKRFEFDLGKICQAPHIMDT